MVVPVFNGAQFLTDTLRSVAAQTHADLEIIVVDDASTDGSAQVALDSGIALRLIQQPNSGVSQARNTGLAAATGEFVCFLDQDDHWFDAHLARQVACFRQHPDIGAVVCPYQHWYPGLDGYALPEEVLPADAGTRTDPDFSGWVYHQFLLDNWALTSATMVRRSVLERYGGFDVERPYSEDWELWLRLSREVRFAKLDWPPVLYRQHAVQGSRKARMADHRCDLLASQVEQHGLQSRDGRAVSARVFKQTWARYRMEFGYHHLQYGDAGIGVRALLEAWRCQPTRLRCLAFAAAGVAGWRPAQPRLSDPRV